MKITKKDKTIVVPFYWDVVSVRGLFNGKTEVIVYNRKTGEVQKNVV